MKLGDKVKVTNTDSVFLDKVGTITEPGDEQRVLNPRRDVHWVSLGGPFGPLAFSEAELQPA